MSAPTKIEIPEDEEEEEEEEEGTVAAEGGEEEEEEDEPEFRYQRLSSADTGGLEDVLRSNPCRRMLAVRPRGLLLFGLEDGRVLVCSDEGVIVRVLTPHIFPVNAMSVDDTGEVLATCADDARVVISSLVGRESRDVAFERPVKAVALCPAYTRRNNKPFVSGGLENRLIMTSKGWFKKDHVLDEGEGAIHAISWNGPFIAYANDRGVRVYDDEHQMRIFKMPLPDSLRNPSQFPCTLFWKREDQLLIGWGYNVFEVQINNSTREDQELRKAPPRHGKIRKERSFKTGNYVVCGLRPYDDKVVILSYPEIEATEAAVSGEPARQVEAQLGWRLRAGEAPEVRIIDFSGMAPQESSTDVLSMRGYENCSWQDYSLEHAFDRRRNSIFYVVSSRDIVVVSRRTFNDHIEWLLSIGKYQDATREAHERAGELPEGRADEVGQICIEKLFESESYQEAANLCELVFGDHSEWWSDWLYRFDNKKQLHLLAPKIPFENHTLDKALYEMVLSHFVDTPSLLLAQLSRWPPSLYDATAVIRVVEDELQKRSPNIPLDLNTDRHTLTLCLAKLYQFAGNHEKTLSLLLDMKSEQAFSFVEEHGMFEAVEGRLLDLVRINRPKALKMFARHPKEIKTDAVVDLLKATDRRQLCEYLDAVFERDRKQSSSEKMVGTKHHDLQLEVYAEFEPSRMMELLKRSESYNLDKARELCIKHGMLREEIYLLGRMGNTEEGLTMIITNIKSVISRKRAKEIFLNKQLPEEFRRPIGGEGGATSSSSSSLLSEEDRLRAHKFTLPKDVRLATPDEQPPLLCSHLNRLRQKIEDAVDQEIRFAVSFCQEHDDFSLWQSLIMHCCEVDEFGGGGGMLVSSLLDHTDPVFVDPIQLIRSIPDTVHVTHLKDKLVRIIADYSLQRVLQQGTFNILKSDFSQLAQRYNMMLRQGKRVDETSWEGINPTIKREDEGMAVMFHNSQVDTCHIRHLPNVLN